MNADALLCGVVSECIAESIGESFSVKQVRAVGGGCVSAAFIVSSDARSFFIKTHASSSIDMFQAEADGLNELAAANAIKIPDVICLGETSAQTFLVLENLSLSGANAGTSPRNFCAEKLGRQLAALHKQTQQKQFGWYRDNTIGATPQINTYSHAWVDFYREHRLQYQLSLAESKGYGGELQILGARLCESLDAFFQTYQPYPALLHGDLWSGNYGYVDAINESNVKVPVLFDPAVYYGDREADIAMTELFGGFSPSFYEAYNDVLPLDEGFELRKTLYNLYHILNHLNLFGSGYHSQAINMMTQLLVKV